MRRHRAWSWVLLVIFVLLVAIAGIGGYAAKTMYEQAKEVKAHEQNAVSMLSGFSGKKDLNSLDQISQKLPQVQSETRQANDIAHGRLWNLAAKAPYIGNDIKTVQGMTSTVDGIVHDSVPQFINVVSQLKSAKLTDGQGQINLQPVLQAQQGMKKANAALQAEVKDYHNLPGHQAKIAMVRKAYDDAGVKLDALSGKIDQVCNTFQILPDFLGATKPQTYVVLSMTTSEARSSGGLGGSLGTLTTNNGQITMGSFRPNTDYVNYDTNPSADERALFYEWGPLQSSFDIRDVGFSPDISRVAEQVKTSWDKTPWGAAQPIDGVITIDPVFLQALIRINGNVTLPNGVVLTGDNTARFLLNTVYKQYDPRLQDVVFGEVALQSIGSMFSGLNLSKLAAIGSIMGPMTQGRHFDIYAFDQTIERNFANSGYSPQSPDNETQPKIGVYVNEQNASKMDWYVHRTSTVTKTSGGKTGQQTYHVDYKMTNTLTRAEASTITNYVGGGGILPFGAAVEKTFVYAPMGGSISNLTITGNATAPTRVSFNGKNPFASNITLVQGASATISFDVTTSPKSAGELALDQTPMGWEDPGIAKVNY